MEKITYKNLLTLVVEEIQKYNQYPTTDSWKDQSSKDYVTSPILFGAASNTLGIGELSNTLSDLLREVNPSAIRSGLTLEATDPITNKIIIRAGQGSVGSSLYSLNNDITVEVPFDTNTEVFYVNLFIDGIKIERDTSNNKVLLGKIIVPKPGVTNKVKDNINDDDIWDAYIINLKEYVLHGDAYGNLEEDSIEMLRDNIGDILADNLIGNIRLSEDLKIINTSGSIELDSSSLKIKDSNEKVLSKFNRNGVFLYDNNGVELAKFIGTEARIGNIKIFKDSLQSGNFVTGSTGFKISDSGDVEFNNLEVRGTIYATAGEIGGFTIASDKMYGTTTGTIQTSENVGAGNNGVVLDFDGLRVYNDVLGLVANFPSDGSAPTISSGTITEVIYEISTNAVLRTSETVGDGTVSSAGILINNTGLYGCEASQTLNDANLKTLIDGTVRLSGEIRATAGEIGGVTITSTKLSGGLIEGATLRGGVFETSENAPKIRIDSKGIYYLITSSIGKYGESGSGLLGFQYGDGSKYGAGVRAYFANTDYPPVAILAEDTMGDIRLYDRLNLPVVGTYVAGDLICVDTVINSYDDKDSSFVPVGSYIDARTDDPTDPVSGRMWIRTDL